MDDLEKQKIELAVQEKEFALNEFLRSFNWPKRVLLITLAVLVIPIYFIAEYSVSTIFISNFSKTQILAHEASFTKLPVTVVESKVLHIKDDSYSLYAIVKNPNKDLSADNISWTAKIYDLNGKEVYAATNNFYLLPGDQKYLIIPNIRLASAPGRNEVTVGDANWVKRINIPNVILTTTLDSYGDQNSPAGFSIKGGFTNQSNFNLNEVVAKGVLTDSSGKVIAVTQTFADTIAPKERRDFQMYWPVTYSSQLGGKPQLHVETDLLDPNNLN